MPGLTGIVGPNGCGKSNVVEALRWAMGENSARSLRGGEMDDVIFAGTAGRASRNIAEVTLTLDETAGAVPPPFHEQSELEIIRRIERGSGSTYRVNGKEVRARDVQTLFADLASGARASGMVSQGRVGALVTAKPEDRRAVLEEAAGITGLHARRHEAELKLRAAEANLARAEDLRGQLEAQLAGLKRQARQASRYRNISGAIRQRRGGAAGDPAGPRGAAARRGAGGVARRAAWRWPRRPRPRPQAAAHAADAAAALPPLRDSRGGSRAPALERHRVAQEQLAAEEERARAALADATRRLEQLRPGPRPRRTVAPGRRGGGAAAGCRGRGAGGGRCRPRDAGGDRRGGRAAEAAEAVRLAEADTNRATEAAAEANARVADRVADAAAGRATRRGGWTEQLARLQDGTRPDRRPGRSIPARLDDAQRGAGGGRGGAGGARAGALEQIEQVRAATATALAAARERQSAADSARAKLAAEAQALAEVLAVKDGERWPPMVDALAVPDGLETALGAALGEELTSAPIRTRRGIGANCRRSTRRPRCPGAPTPLAALVQGPPALARALSQIGLVEDDATGEAHAGRSGAGPGIGLARRAPSGAGTAIPSAPARPPQAAVRLQQRNRLATAARATGFAAAR